jgi:flagellar motor switch protein FliN/FliY
MASQGAEAAVLSDSAGRRPAFGAAEAAPGWDASRYHSEVKEAMSVIDANFGQAEPPASRGPDLATPRTVRADAPQNLETILRIPVSVQVVLGSATMPVANLLKLGRGAVIPLDHRVGEPVDVVVNGRLVARGEVVVVEDDNSRFGVSLTEIIGPTGAEGVA